MTNLHHVSLFAGVGGADLGMEAAGIPTVLACEIDKNARAVLAHRFPNTTLHDDVRTLTGDDLRRAGAVPERTILSGGFPCQPFSVAGRRGGMGGDDERGDLYWEISRLLAEFPARWIVLENVPGLLSIDAGRTFGTILGDLGELGYGVAYRVLDAQHFGVPQRRRRVFIVGCLGDDRRPVEVLLEPEGCRGNPAPSLAPGPGTPARAERRVAATLTAGLSSDGVSAPGRRQEDDINIVVNSLTAAQGGADDNDAQGGHLVPWFVKAKRAATDQDDETWRQGGVSPTLNDFDSDVAPRLGATSLGMGVTGPATTVRRLTPRECERLMGWPDDHTRYRLAPGGAIVEQADSNRYRQCGNGMASPVVAWIARRIIRAAA